MFSTFEWELASPIAVMETVHGKPSSLRSKHKFPQCIQRRLSAKDWNLHDTQKRANFTLRKANRKRKHEKFIYTSWTCPAGFLLCDTGHILQAQGLQRGSTGNEAWILWSQRRASTSYSSLLSLAFSLASSCVHVTVREPEIRLKSEKRVKLSPCGVGHQIRAWNEEKKIYITWTKSVRRSRISFGERKFVVVMRLFSADMCGFIIICCYVTSLTYDGIAQHNLVAAGGIKAAHQKNNPWNER